MEIPLSKIHQLEEAFKHDASHEEAAAIAKVTLADLYDYIALNDTWYQNCLLSAHEPIAKAKMNLGTSVLSGDLEASKYLLERKRPKEWSPKAQLDITTSKPLVIYDLAATQSGTIQPIEVGELASKTAGSLGRPPEIQVPAHRGVEGAGEKLLHQEVSDSPAV